MSVSSFTISRAGTVRGKVTELFAGIAVGSEQFTDNTLLGWLCQCDPLSSSPLLLSPFSSITSWCCGGRGTAAFCGTVCRDSEAQWGCDPSLFSAVLTSAQSVRATQLVLWCPSSSASLRRETDSSYLKVNIQLSHLKCQREQLGSRQPKARGRKEERDTKRSVTP